MKIDKITVCEDSYTVFLLVRIDKKDEMQKRRLDMGEEGMKHWVYIYVYVK